MVDMGPIKETGFGEIRDGDTGVVDGEDHFRPEAAFAIEQIAISDTQQEMKDACKRVAFQQGQDADTREKNDLDAAEEQV
jgi:hypothetical protein